MKLTKPWISSASGRLILMKLAVRLSSLIMLALVFTSCQLSTDRLEPIVQLVPPSHRISALPSAFEPLSIDERGQEWGKELLIGDAFAREVDLYRAITCYKRALVLLPEEAMERRLQLEYNLIYSYYIGSKYLEAVNIFETSSLSFANPLFPAFSNLLILLYDSYQQLGQEEKAACLLESIEKYSPETAEDLLLYWRLKKMDLQGAQAIIPHHRDAEAIQSDLSLYYQFAKSPKKARTLNALLPGAGYYYVGQTRTAFTSFVINALFTAASYQFFQRGYPAAGAIVASLEMGWYFGGINGAGIEADEYNNRLYEGVAKKTLIDHQLFPLLMFETSF